MVKMSRSLSAGARQLPLRHLSIRVPWNDTSWEGQLCKKPGENIACLILPRIRSNRQDDEEIEMAGDLPPRVGPVFKW